VVSRLLQGLTANSRLDGQANHSTDHVRRRRERGCGRPRARCGRSSSCRCSGRARRFRTPCCEFPTRRCSSVRSSSPIPPIVSWCSSSLPRVGIEADVLREPMRRDSGPAIAAGAAFAQTRDGDAVVLALAADHVVRDTAAFVAACRQGQVAAEAGCIVTCGVRPERPATEYGYINPGEPVSARSVRSQNSSKSRIRQRPPDISRPDISGTAATSCSARERSARRISQCRYGQRAGESATP